MASSRFIPSHWTGSDGVFGVLLLEELLLLFVAGAAALLERRAEKSIPPALAEFVAGRGMGGGTVAAPSSEEKFKPALAALLTGAIVC